MNPPAPNDVSTALGCVKKPETGIWEISDKGRKWLASVKPM
jgi:hypothetical protein